MASVSIAVGKHTMTVPKGMEQLVGEFMRKHKLEGKYVGYLGERTLGRGHKKGKVKAVRVIGHTLTLDAQPGDNDTSFEVHVHLDGKDANAIFAKMRQLCFTKVATDTNKTETVVAGNSSEATEQITEQIKDDGKGGVMVEEKKAKWFEVKKFLKDEVNLHVILFALAEHQSRSGVEILRSSACVAYLKASELIAKEYDNKAVSRILPVLAEMGYLEATDKRGQYLLAQKTKDLVGMAQSTEAKGEQKAVVDNPTADTDMEQKIKARVALISAYTRIEHETTQLRKKLWELEKEQSKMRKEIEELLLQQ